MGALIVPSWELTDTPYPYTLSLVATGYWPGGGQMESLTLHITGMSCGHCLNAVNSALARLDGVAVKSARIGRADIEFDPARISPAEIAAAVNDAGYAAVPASRQ